MKPTLGMDTKLPETMVESCAQKNPKRSRLIAGVVIGLVTFVTVAAVVIVSVYFGVKLTRDNYKESWVTFKTAKGDTVQEKISVTNNEEVNVNVPNDMRIVFDYKNGITVYRFRDSQTKKEGACYAYYINRTDAGTPSQVREDMANTEVDVSEDRQSSEQKFLVTDRKLPTYMVSDNVQKMCGGTDVYWMEKSRDHDGITKRSTPCNTWYYLYRYCFTGTDGIRYCYYIRQYPCPDGTYEYYYKRIY